MGLNALIFVFTRAYSFRGSDVPFISIVMLSNFWSLPYHYFYQTFVSHSFKTEHQSQDISYLSPFSHVYSYSESQNMNASNFFHLFFVALSQILLECFTKRIHTDYWLVNTNLNIKSCKSVRYSLRWASLTWTNYVQLCLVSMMFQLLFHRSHQASLSVTLSGLFTSLSFDSANIMTANMFGENLFLRILLPK